MNNYKQNEQWQQNLLALAEQESQEKRELLEQTDGFDWLVEQKREEAEVMSEMSHHTDTWTKHFRYNPEFPVQKNMRIFVPRTYGQ